MRFGSVIAGSIGGAGFIRWALTNAPFLLSAAAGAQEGAERGKATHFSLSNADLIRNPAAILAMHLLNDFADQMDWGKAAAYHIPSRTPNGRTVFSEDFMYHFCQRMVERFGEPCIGIYETCRDLATHRVAAARR